MTKSDILETLETLFALESWSYCLDKPLPDHLMDNVWDVQDKLRKELLIETNPLHDEVVSVMLALGDAYDCGQPASHTSAIGRYRLLKKTLCPDQ